MTHRCVPACTARWSAGRKCHCSACGENFSTVRNFDKHRDDECLEPGKAGLVLNDRGTWTLPGETDIQDRLRAATGNTDR